MNHSKHKLPRPLSLQLLLEYKTTHSLIENALGRPLSYCTKGSYRITSKLKLNETKISEKAIVILRQ